MRRCGWHLVLVLTGHVGSERGRNKWKRTKTSLPLLHARGRRKRNSAL